MLIDRSTGSGVMDVNGNLKRVMAEYIGLRAMRYWSHSYFNTDMGYITGVTNSSAWTRNGITYRKSRYFTFNAANKQPSPKVLMIVSINPAGQKRMASITFTGC